MMLSKFRNHGVTLIELLVVVLILAALAAIAIPRVSKSAEKAKISACDTNIDVINQQIEVYYADNGKYPTSLKKVTENTDYFPDGKPACPLNGTYKYNTTTKRAYCTHN